MAELTSQNGWRAYATPTMFTRFTAAGFSGWAANPDVVTLFTELIERFNAEVEPIAGPVRDDWTWAYRPVRGQTRGLSNHGSATAVDLNATQHPRGVYGTFSPAQFTAIRKILASITDDSGHPIFRWGHDYIHAPVDDMHFEINDDPHHAREAADRLRARKPKETDMTPDDKITLSAVAAHAMSAAPGAKPRKEGDQISVSYFLQWGGAGLALARTEVAELAARVASLESKVAVLGGGTVHQVSGNVSMDSGSDG